MRSLFEVTSDGHISDAGEIRALFLPSGSDSHGPTQRGALYGLSVRHAT